MADCAWHPPMREAAPHRRGRFVVAAVCAVTFLALAGAAEEGGEAGLVFSIDATTQTVVRSQHSATLDDVMRAVTHAGSGGVLVPLNLAVIMSLWRRHRRLAWFVPIVTAGSVVIEGIAKWLVARPRPGSAMSYGFPSGHVLASVVFFGAVIYCGWALPLPRPLRWLGVGICLVTIVAVAYSRLYLNAHWLTDVLGAFAGGLAYLLLAVSVMEGRGDRG